MLQVARIPACPSSVGGVVKLVIVGLVVVFLVFYIMTSPDQAANIFHGTWHTSVRVAHGLGSFVDKLAK
jgi:NADH:ubiquinone oxidoreductase subunit 6 (subunit J)